MSDNAKLTAKDRMAIERTTMPEQDPTVRATNFKEVNLGLSEQAAIGEARRCLMCKNRPCVAGCPVSVRIPEFLGRLAEGDFEGAAEFLRADNALPAIAGRVCPQEVQCESKCVRGKNGQPVAVGWLERFVADKTAGNVQVAAPAEPTGFKVAVVGSGPGGLTAAGELARMGHEVTILEALHDSGGVLRYGIPEFRLPKRIVDQEVETLGKLGVTIQFNVIVGKTITIQQIMEHYDACFVANGAGLPMFMNIPGENLKGVYSANEYLTRVNLMGAWKGDEARTPIARGKTAVVFGGGNTAMDGVRTARRLGSERAILAYRRTEAEMPARIEEIAHAREEGIEFMFLASPLEIIGDDNGWVTSVKMQRMELGEPDASGRRRPVPIDGDVFDLPADIVIVAIGTQANPLLTATAPGLTLNKWGNIETDESQMTSIPGVFAGGDIVRGGATVILAMGDGKRAAKAIDEYLAAKTAAKA